MIISEARLYNLIQEEVEFRIIKQTITEVITEMNLGLSDEEQLIIEQSVLDALKKATGNNTKLILTLAGLALGSQIGNNLQILDDVGVTPGMSQQLQNASDARDYVQILKDKELQKRVEKAMERGTAEKGVDLPDEKRTVVVDTFLDDYGDDLKILASTSGPVTDRMGNPYVYVPYGKIIDKDPTYTDYTTGKEGIDGKRERYQQQGPDKIKDLVKDLNMYGSYGHGKFKSVEIGGVKAKLLTPDFSAAVQGYLDKMQARSPEGRAAAADADVVMTVTPDSSPELDSEFIKKTNQRSTKNIKNLQQKRK
tara:strand:+ start:59 stop:985 length:927 start_codon:yes stop_codon:yes gene_type:complete